MTATGLSPFAVIFMKSIWKKLWRSLAAFGAARSGNVAITFALALLPVVGAVGAAVDYSHANSVKTALQSALDSTALMLAKSAQDLTKDELNAKALTYFNALFTRPEGTNIVIDTNYTTDGGSTVVINGSADVPTIFMEALGYDKITVSGSSTTRWGTSRMRVALVLDNTGSMASDGKIDALKAATKSLLDQLKSAATTDGDIYVSIIPFSKDVNVGKYNASWDSWIDWNAMAPSPPEPSVGPGSNCPYSIWGDRFTCVTTPGGSTTTSRIPSSGTYAGAICPSNSVGCYDSQPTTTTSTNTVNSCNNRSNCTCTGHGNGKVCTQTVTTTGAPYTHKWFVDNTGKANWNGCVTDRGNAGGPNTNDYDRNVTEPDPSIAASQFPAEQFSACTAAIMGLNYNWTAMNSLVDSMQPNGSTNQPIGLVWGWQSLVGGGPLIAPPKNSNYQYQEVIVLLSDGLNTADRWYGNGSSTSISVNDRMLNSTGEGTCANIKAAGITIYTLQVNTGGDPTSTLLQKCASDTGKFFLVTKASDIANAFDKIGTDLKNLRVAK